MRMKSCPGGLRRFSCGSPTGLPLGRGAGLTKGGGSGLRRCVGGGGGGGVGGGGGGGSAPTAGGGGRAGEAGGRGRYPTPPESRSVRPGPGTGAALPESSPAIVHAECQRHNP